MKRVLMALLPVAAVMLSPRAMGDEKSQALLSALWSRICAMENYEIKFAVNYGGNTNGGVNMEGFYLVSGQGYYLSAGGTEVFCDGQTRYEVEPANKTVSIMSVDRNDRSIFANPTRAFDLLDGSFAHSYAGTTKYSGAECSLVELRPKDKSQPIGQMSIYIDNRSGLPLAVKYMVEKEPLWIKITSVSAVVKPDKAKMTFDRKKYKGYDIVDFR